MLPDSSEYVNEFFGLPAHALLVHGAVVLLPLCAIGVILLAFIGSWRRKYGWLVLFGLFVATMFAYFSKESGESLAEVVGRPERHADLGTWLPIVAAVLFLLTLIWLPLARSGDRPVSKSTTTPSVSGDATQVLTPTSTTEPRGPGGFTRFMALLAVIAAVTTLVWTIMVGHSGATAVWGDVVNPTPTPSPTQPSPSPTPTPSETATRSPSPTPSPTRTTTPSPTRSPITPSPTRSFPSVSPNAADASPLFDQVLPEDQLEPAPQ